MFSPLFRTGCCCLRFSMHCPFRRCILVVTSFSSLFSSVPRRGCPALFLHFLSIPLPSIPGCGCSVFFSSFFFYFQYPALFFHVFPSFPHRLLLPSFFDALPLPSLYIGCHLVFFFIFLCSPPRLSGCGCSVFFHPSFLFSVSYALSLTFLLIFRAGCCCLRFSMHYPFISAVRHFFFIFFLFPFLLFPAAVVPCFFHPSFFIFSILLSFSMFSPLFRTGCCCLRFSMHCPFRRCILVVTSFSSLFSSVPRRGCPALFLHFLSIPLPSIPGCGCSVFFSSFFFYFQYPALFFHVFPSFPHRLFLRFFLVPGRK